MFTNDPNQIRRIVTENQNDQYRRAARIRLAREATAVRAPFYTVLIVSLGKRMVAWGNRVQSQYNELASGEFAPSKYDTATIRKSA